MTTLNDTAPNPRPRNRLGLSRLVSLDFVRGFDAAARHLSFTAAAHELSITQSAVSKQIKTLEERLGVKLFHRYNRRLALTADGTAFHHAVDSALQTIDSAAEQLRPSPSDRTLTVSTSLTFASLWLVPRLSRFREAYPEIELRILADDRILDARENDIDISIRFCDPGQAPTNSRRLFSETVLPMCSPERLRAQPLLGPRDLAKHVLLQLDTPILGLPWLDWHQWLRAMGVADLRATAMLRFSNYAQIVQAACDGTGVLLGRLPLLQGHLDRGLLVTALARQAAPARDYVVIRSEARPSRADLEAFENWLFDDVAEHHDALQSDTHQGLL